MIAYIGLFSAAFIAATFLPMQSEALLVALLLNNAHSVTILLIVATAGNVLGSVVNWVLGRMALRFQNRRWFPATADQLSRAEKWYRRYGRWSLLASWLPIVGDGLTIMAGVLREPLWSFIAIITIAKGARYVVLAMLTFAWFPQGWS